MIFEKTINAPTGDVFYFHRIMDKEVDVATGKLTVYIRSWTTEEEAEKKNGNWIDSRVVIDYTPEILVGLEETVATLSWDFYNNEFAPPPVYTLEELKQQKRDEFDLIAQNLIYGGFDSSALGASHHYPTKDKDQANLTLAVGNSYNPANAPTWTVAIKTIDSLGVTAYRNHTAAQIQQVGNEAYALREIVLNQNQGYQDGIDAATTVEELNEIVWD